MTAAYPFGDMNGELLYWGPAAGPVPAPRRPAPALTLILDAANLSAGDMNGHLRYWGPAPRCLKPATRHSCQPALDDEDAAA